MHKQDWQGSRWEYTKNKSSWHFDPTISGESDFLHVCRFNGDWVKQVEEYSNLSKSATWSTRNPKVNRVYSANEEEADLIKANANPDMEIYKRVEAHECPIFVKMAEYFQMKDVSIKFHLQTTGQMLVWHIDNFVGRRERENSFIEIEADKNPSLLRRFVIALDDWKHGQIFALGNSFWHQWKSGECITWEWQDMPHGTCNIGWDPRPLLQITGIPTAHTQEIICAANKHTIINL